MRILEDITQYADGSKLRVLSTIFLNPNFHCVMWYRLANILGRVRILIPLSKLIMYLNRVFYSVDIDYRANLAGGFKLVHGIGTVIGLNVKTEGPVKVYQGVTLGGNNNKVREANGRKFSQPWLMANTTIYANTTVIGPVIIGCGAVVGANCVLTKDVPEGKTVYSKTEIRVI